MGTMRGTAGLHGGLGRASVCGDPWAAARCGRPVHVIEGGSMRIRSIALTLIAGLAVIASACTNTGGASPSASAA